MGGLPFTRSLMSVRRSLVCFFLPSHTCNTSVRSWRISCSILPPIFTSRSKKRNRGSCRKETIRENFLPMQPSSSVQHELKTVLQRKSTQGFLFLVFKSILSDLLSTLRCFKQYDNVYISAHGIVTHESSTEAVDSRRF